MLKKYQVTIYCTTGEYRPVSCIIIRDTDNITRLGERAFIDALKKDGIQKICAQRNWNKADLLRYHYTKMKMREYDEEKIKQEKEKKNQIAIEKTKEKENK